MKLYQTGVYVTSASIVDLYGYFEVLADRKRLRIIQYLTQHDEITVSRLGDEMRLSQPLISWHLRKLRRAGIVKTRRVGRQVWCSLNRASISRYEAQVAEALGIDGVADEGVRDTLPLASGQR